MPGSMPATSQLDWLSSMTAMIVLFWSRATRDLLKSFGWGIAGTPSIRYSDEVAIFRRPPHSIYRFRLRYSPSGSSLGVSADLSTLPSRKRSSQRTQRWREMDSNHQYRIRNDLFGCPRSVPQFA